MTERREIFGAEEIKELVRVYQAWVDELSVVYYNQDDTAIQKAENEVDDLLKEWGLWDDDYGWTV
jgi:hypothetical protein